MSDVRRDLPDLRRRAGGWRGYAARPAGYAGADDLRRRGLLGDRHVAQPAVRLQAWLRRRRHLDRARVRPRGGRLCHDRPLDAARAIGGGAGKRKRRSVKLRRLVLQELRRQADQKTFLIQLCGSAARPYWISTRCLRSSIATGPAAPPLMTKSPLAEHTLPIGEITAAVPQAKASISLPLAASARHWSIVLAFL